MGKCLGGYELGAVIGAGGMATVYHVTAAAGIPGVPQDLPLAIKVIHPHLHGAPSFLERFEQEGRLGLEIRHPNVVRTLDFGSGVLDDEVRHYLVMEYVEGTNLDDLLRESNRLSERLCRHVGAEVARALDAIHAAGIVHRDLKPANVLILRDEVVKVMDLGVAYVKDQALRLSVSGTFQGTLPYASPEQIRPRGRKIDARADLYSLGLLLYELATGENPFPGQDALQVIRMQLEEPPRRPGLKNPQISSFLEEVILKLLQKQREDRFAAADDVRRILEQGENSDWWRSRSGVIRRQTSRPPRRMRLPRATPLFGRDEALQILRRKWESARRGEGKVVLIEGETGIGKSRLVDELAATLEAEHQDVNIVFGSYPPGGAGVSSRAISEGFLQHFGDAQLEHRLTELLPGLPELVSAFASFLRGDPLPSNAAWFSRDAVVSLFVRLNRALSEERPTLLLVDDLHFATREGRALFAAMAHAAPESALLVVATTTEELPADYLADLTLLEQTTRLPLERLDADEIHGLIAAALKSESSADELSDLVVRFSDGIPYFALEYIEELKQQEVLAEKSSGAWMTVASLQSLPQPPTLRDLESARIGALNPQQRELLEAAACCGFKFDPGLISEALDWGRLPVLRSLGQIERKHRLIRSLGHDFRFDHQQVQQTLYEELPVALREEYHAALGEALVKRQGDPRRVAGEQAVQICFHLLTGSRGTACRDWLDAALDYLTTSHHNQRAAELADLALDTPGILAGEDRGGVLLRKAKLQFLVGNRDAVEGVAKEAILTLDEAGETTPAIEARAVLARHHWERGESETAIEILTQALDLAGMVDDPRLHGSILGDLGNVSAQSGQYDAAANLYRQRMDLSREVGDRAGEAASIGSLGVTALEQGRLDEATELFGRALPIFEELGDLRAQAITCLNLGFALHDLGSYPEAGSALRKSVDLCRKIGYRRGEASALGNLGLVCAAEGNFARALDHTERDLRIQLETRDEWNQGNAHQLLGIHLLTLGALSLAREHLVASRDIFARIRFTWGLIGTLISLARTDEEEGHLKAAREGYEESLRLSREIGKEPAACRSLRHLGIMMLAEGRKTEARKLIEESHELSLKNSARDLKVLTSATLAVLTKDGSSVRRLLEEERGRLPATTVMDARYRLWLAEGNSENLHLAWQVLRRLADGAPPEHRSTVIRGLRLHRCIEEDHRRVLGSEHSPATTPTGKDEHEEGE